MLVRRYSVMNLNKIMSVCGKLVKDFSEFRDCLIHSGEVYCEFESVKGVPLNSEEKSRLTSALSKEGWIGMEEHLVNSKPSLKGTPIETLQISDFTVAGENIVDSFGNIVIAGEYNSLYPGFVLSALKDEFGSGKFTVTKDVLYPILGESGFLKANTREGRIVVSTETGISDWFKILPSSVNSYFTSVSKAISTKAFSAFIPGLKTFFDTAQRYDVLHVHMSGDKPAIESACTGQGVIYSPRADGMDAIEGLVKVLERKPYVDLNVSDVYLLLSNGSLSCCEAVACKPNSETTLVVY